VEPSSFLWKWCWRVQTVETDGALAAKSFTVNNHTYLFIANAGSTGRYETKSRLYKVLSNGTLTVVRLNLLHSQSTTLCCCKRKPTKLTYLFIYWWRGIQGGGGARGSYPTGCIIGCTINNIILSGEANLSADNSGKPLGGRCSALNPDRGAHCAPADSLAGGEGLLPPKNPTPSWPSAFWSWPPIKTPGHALAVWMSRPAVKTEEVYSIAGQLQTGSRVAISISRTDVRVVVGIGTSEERMWRRPAAAVTISWQR